MSHEPFQGTARFKTRRQLGSGTAGVVYEAWDGERGCPVALKLLHQSDPASLYRFKQEFRALAHLSHPNLIQLYELLHEDDQWFVTMELVDGVDFIRYVRAPEVLENGVEALEARLRPVAKQLGRGLRALHASGRLHRDIKPSNVLVTPGGRVVVLDFGLVTKATAHQTFQSFTEDILGTPAYMAPEQGVGQDLTEATDWWAVGALIFEALTGEPPFSGQFVQVMLAKQRSDPRPPKELVAEISEDWDELCRDLLRREVELRPTGFEILQRLGVEDDTDQRPTQSQEAPALFGRGVAIEAMWRVFDRVLAGEAAVLYVHGASGLGKSALVRRFLLEVRRKHPDAVALSGRCYEHESVPYKALDSVIDMLTRYLRNLSDEEVVPLLPRDVLGLARLFPVLRRVRAVADAERRVLEIPDSLEVRRRAFAALREILTRMAEDHPLAIFIDDLQWGDADSAGLLAALMRPPDAPPLLLIGAYRAEDASTNPLVRELRADATTSLNAVPGEDLEVRELDTEAAELLAQELLDTEDDRVGPVAREVARESHGNPLFIDELVRHTLTGGEVAHGNVVRGGLDEVVRRRMIELPPEARRLLEVLAVAGQPIVIDVARRAAGLEAGELAAFTVLRVGNLARSTGARGVDRIEIFHDRIEKAVLAEIDPGRRRAYHQRLARELESTGRGDPEALAHHFAEAGENVRALEYATEAAEESVRALAFNRAARLYRGALDLEVADEEQERTLCRRLAEAYVSAGRSAEAAEIYVRLSHGAARTEALEMRRKAAERWLVSGHIDQGLEALRDVLNSLGWKLPSTARGALPGLLLRRAWLRLRGYGFKERDATRLSAEQLNRIDTCWSAAVGLAVVDTVRGAAFQARHLLLALDAGEPLRVALALALEVGYSASAGGRQSRRVRKLRAAAAEAVRRAGDPYAMAFAAFASGLAAYLQGRWKEALGELEKAEKIFRERCTGVAWEIDGVHFYTLMALGQLGRIGELLQRLPVQLKEARERGDLYSLTGIRSRVGWLADLAADEPELARARLAAAIAVWTPREFHLQHLWNLLGRVETALYAGTGREAWEQIDGHWNTIRKSLVLRIRTTSASCHNVHGRAALAAAREGGAAAAGLLRSAERDARRIARLDMPWSNPIAEMLFAGIAGARDRAEEALRRFTAAAEGFVQADMALHAAVARIRRGEVLGGDEGRELRAAAEAWMKEQGIRDPRRMADQMAPAARHDEAFKRHPTSSRVPRDR